MGQEFNFSVQEILKDLYQKGRHIDFKLDEEAAIKFWSVGGTSLQTI